MVNPVYESLLKYFNVLSKEGYYNYVGTSKLLFVVLMQEFCEEDFDLCMDEDVKAEIDRMIGSVIGTDCLLPYPSNCRS